ncbi:hypothetical protein HY950_02510, partial [Candidatus Gottesmanbacteria bacterium]|nr:hypothetical protein [Candidatus Gottesmanbacteria bacterium]
MSKFSDEVHAFRKKLDAAKVPKELKERIAGNLEEVSRLENDISARVHIEQIFAYTDWVVSLPWDTRTTDVLDIA